MNFFVFTLFCLLPLFAISQEKTIVKEIEKTISVDVNKDDNGHRDVKITSTINGDEKVFKWKDDGNIPEDIKSQLEAEGIDLNILDSTDDLTGDDVEIHIDRKEMTSPKNIVIKMIEDEGGGQVLEWNGEGDMPEEMQDLLEEHDIDIESMGNDSQVKKARIKRIKKESKEKSKRARNRGRKMNKSQNQKYRTVTIDEDGNQKVREWESKGGKKKIHKKGDHNMLWIGDNDDEENIFIMKGHRRKKPSDAYIGAHISASEEVGALVEDISANGPASKSDLRKGDVIQKINGARIKSMDDLLDLLSYYEPADQVALTVSRNGEIEEITLILGKHPSGSRL